MKARPILFSAEMVRAILDGRKTQTRRVMKPQPEYYNSHWHWAGAGWNRDDVALVLPGHSMANRCPYGQIGDRLWVRETWAHDDPDCDDIHCGNPDHIWWRANEEKIVADSFAGKARWRPAIYMPHWASRIHLEIVNVRVERLQHISRDDAKAEGVSNLWKWDKERNLKHPEHFSRGVLNPYVANYSVLWDQINASRGYGWKFNPWVWVIEFKKTGEP
jgi:hypothetical protein